MSLPYNFSPGPAMLPPEVLDQVRADLPEWHWHGVGQGASVMEVSHRGKAFEALIAEAEQDLRDLLAIPANYRVIFMQGGAWGQFAAVPMNLLRPGETADYLVSGGWSKSAVGEAAKFGAVNVLASSESDGYTSVPARNTWKSTWTENGVQTTAGQSLQPPSYIYACSNETVYGNEIHTLPRDLPAPLVIDASSHFLSRPMDVAACGLIYAGAQKNIGPAGVTIVIVRDDLLDRAPMTIPSVFHYKHMAANKSLFNTPPVFSIYVTALTLKWIKAQGGLAEMECRAIARSALLYDTLDASQLFKAPVARTDRSRMNVVFDSGNADTDAAFVAFCDARGLKSLKGHRVRGGMRASLYNAMPLSGVEALVTAVREFEATHSR
ncbi:MAG: 3-phosphoserine/phosphohydroxythreonine transaminase [Burkholderiales bacterium]|nr:3-phosphoserine/phosphohydroxythreonine transaminase [Burkholderiales bacterium]